MNNGKLIGYVALGRDVCFTDGRALIVRGVNQRDKLVRELAERNLSRLSIKKAYEKEILHILENGLGGYAFDEESYERFCPLAQAAGLAVPTTFDFTPSAPGLTKHLVIEFKMKPPAS